jgi:biofilm protein TabA
VVLDSLENAALYHALGPRVAAALEYLRAFDPATPDGRHAVAGDEVFALVQRYETAPGQEKRFEAHRLHLDVQFVASGRERILHAPLASLQSAAGYSAADDVEFFHDPAASSSLLLRAGDFALLFPADAHKPGCMAGGREAVRKVVVKVRV